MLRNPIVYLAGPITGCSFKGCTEWRKEVIKELAKDGIVGMSPMREKDFLKTSRKLPASFTSTHPLGTSKGITTRDRNDCIKSDAILINLLGAKIVSVGSMIELGQADIARVPTVLVMEEKGNPHEHVSVQGNAGFIVPTLEEGLDIIRAIVLPGGITPEPLDVRDVH